MPPVTPAMSSVTFPTAPSVSSQSGSGAPWYPPPPPQSWQTQQLPPPVMPMPPVSMATPVPNRYVRATRDGYGATRYEVNTGRVVARTFGSLGIAIAFWFVLAIVLGIIENAVSKDSTLYTFVGGVLGITLLLLPVIPFVVFFTTRGKAKRAIRAMTYGNAPR
jgi:hypothetical protein